MTDTPGFTPETVLRGMSLRRRVGLVLVALAGGCGAALLTLLALTEPEPLPLRTKAAFGALAVMSSCWSAYAAWCLRRMPLFAADRVIAGWLALIFTTVTAIAVLAVAVTRPGPVPLTALATALLSVAVAGWLLHRATARRKALLRFRGEWPMNR
ncbi:hypothetical protein ACTI_62150 [Actinoplanes sp. OR16]|uniref:transmembrane transport protein n=1 Tax=Actinoplanes sp. OR16 TaxID=946334 RepID=UPI000F6FF907|nr:transmembrane transport protein [Actinoplanes sp. OR16]BBH69530.1 hypothetical protein ACTI_62150 [Actinoplanes sp. OR16]